jgi:arsenite/tail-anchored protein-transporting ATPase
MFEGIPRFAFFTGKGGVGKTSLACATAVSLAERGHRVLLVSTDPASNVAQVFETTIGNKLCSIPNMPGLDAIEIDPEAAAAIYRERIVAPLRGVVPDGELKGVIEQLSGACTTEIAAFDEFTALLTNEDLIGRYDHVVFDTAPTGHTIRLLQLPGAWSSFLEDGAGDASCLGPLAGLEKQRDRYAAAVEHLADGGTTQLVLVTRASRSALNEAARTSRELADIGIGNQKLAINGVMPATESSDPLALAIIKREQAALATMDPAIAQLPRETFPLRSENLVGIAALKRFIVGEALPAMGSGVSASEPVGQPPKLGTLLDEVATTGKGLLMFVGKGGVGKTTMAAAAAVELASRGFDVLLTTTDPAAHLSETLSEAVPSLTVGRINPVEETARYRAEVIRSKGAGMDAKALAMLEEDLRSPCTEEIAVFQAFSRTIRESTRHFVVMDTAPTGHTLLLLDATGSYHRDIVRNSAPGSQGRMITPMMRLQDQQLTKVFIVTLPETTPVLEAQGLQNELRRAGIEPWAWVINSSLAVAATTHPLLLKRAEAENRQIAKVRDDLATRYAVVAMQAEEPVGADKLAALVRA